jgi:CubicO group peptidase (beta-lactamase class C family)
MARRLPVPLLCGLCACAHASSGTNAGPAAPPEVGATWPVSTPEAQGIDSAKLAAMVEEISDREGRGENAIHDFVVIRHGVLVAEGYVHPQTPEVLHHQASVTKGVESALVGVAIRERWIPSVDAPLSSLLPGYADVWKDPAKAKVTLEQALSMTAGFDWDDGRDLGPLLSSADPVRYHLSRPMAHAPGTTFVYDTGICQPVARILEERSGQDLEALAVKYLFEPLGIREHFWLHLPGVGAVGGFGLYLAPRDAARIGYLYLHQGRWNGRELLPANWVRASLTPRIPCWDHQMGLYWRVSADGRSFFAHGHGGQFILLRPDGDLVVVINAHDYGQAQGLLDEHIFPALAPGSLPANPEGAARLRAALDRIAQPMPVAQPLPPLAARVSGTSWVVTRAVDAQGKAVPSPVRWGRLTFESPQQAVFEYQQDASPGAPEGVYRFLIGLDGVARSTPKFFANALAMVARGRWIDDATFAFENRLLGQTQEFRLRFHFSGARATAEVETLPEHVRVLLDLEPKPGGA